MGPLQIDHKTCWMGLGVGLMSESRAGVMLKCRGWGVIRATLVGAEIQLEISGLCM